MRYGEHGIGVAVMIVVRVAIVKSYEMGILFERCL